jgi:hypothetical protein
MQLSLLKVQCISSVQNTLHFTAYIRTHDHVVGLAIHEMLSA